MPTAQVGSSSAGGPGFAKRYPGPEFRYGAIFGQGGSRLRSKPVPTPSHGFDRKLRRGSALGRVELTAPRRPNGAFGVQHHPVTSGGRSHRDDLRVTAEPGPSLVLYPAPTQAEARLHRQYLVQQVHGLGARVMFELLEEIARHPGFDDDLNEHLERYAGLDGTFRAVCSCSGSRAQAPRKFSKRTARCRGTVSGRAIPSGPSPGETANDRKPPSAARQLRSPLRDRPTDGRAADHVVLRRCIG